MVGKSSTLYDTKNPDWAPSKFLVEREGKVKKNKGTRTVTRTNERRKRRRRMNEARRTKCSQKVLVMVGKIYFDKKQVGFRTTKFSHYGIVSILRSCWQVGKQLVQCYPTTPCLKSITWYFVRFKKKVQQ